MSKKKIEKIQKMLIREATENGCTVEEAKQMLIKNWGIGGDRGYGIFVSDFLKLEHIEKIDELEVYDNDLDAGKQAEKDGIALIPFGLNPINYPYNCYRFIDTDDNRRVLEKIRKSQQ